MSQLQKNFIKSSTPSLNQVMQRPARSTSSIFHHQSITITKHLLKYISKITTVNLFQYSKKDQGANNSLENIQAPSFNSKILSCSPKSPSILSKGQANRPDISNKCILCIGGRGKLYPEYRCLIESLGGNLLIYRGNQKGDTDRLPNLLTCADMVICPIDCVNHETYFAVKHFCKKSGKPCALLDHCDLITFGKGIETLASAYA